MGTLANAGLNSSRFVVASPNLVDRSLHEQDPFCESAPSGVDRKNLIDHSIRMRRPGCNIFGTNLLSERKFMMFGIDKRRHTLCSSATADIKNDAR